MLKTSNNRIYSINTDDANAVLIWVNSLQKSQIRPISIQTVFKFICSIYQERKKNILNSQAPLHVYCYDFFISQYGLKKIADDKLKKVEISSIFYKFLLIRDYPLVCIIKRKTIELTYFADF